MALHKAGRMWRDPATAFLHGLPAPSGRLPFFDGLDVIEPGVAQPHRWRPAPMT